MTLQATGAGKFETVNYESAVRAMRAPLRLLAPILRFVRATVSELASIIADDMSHGRISRDPHDWER